MRLVKVRVPAGQGERVASLAFQAGIPEVALFQEQVCHADGRRETRDVVDVAGATPAAKEFIDALLAAPFYDLRDCSVTVRQPRSIVTPQRPEAITWPLVEPTADIFQELWQFSYVTPSFVGRTFIAALLLAYGMLQNYLLVMVGGLLFMPPLPLLLAVAFGILARQWRLVAQGARALLLALALIMLAALVVARLIGPPLRFDQISLLPISVLISLGVGVAAGVATGDDAGERTLIGLAAASQVGILPAWLGVWLALGDGAVDGAPVQQALILGTNVVTIVVAALVTYAALRIRGDGLAQWAQPTVGG